MTQDILDQLHQIDRQMLADVVRQDLGSPDFAIGDWQVERLSSKGIINPEGLFLFSGNGQDAKGSRAWSVVLKILRKEEAERDPHDIWYWKRELLVVQHDLLSDLPGPVVAPRFYGTAESPEGAWMWMEHIVPTHNGAWGLEQYALAARAFGLYNGSYLTGKPMPDYAWLCREHCYWWLAGFDETPKPGVWENPFVKEAFPEEILPRLERLWADKGDLLEALNRVPQVFSHFDGQRRNLFIRQRQDSGDEVVAVDWAFAGIGPIGGDLFALVGSTALLCEVEAEEVPALEATAMEAYLSGLSEAGWEGDEELVRLGYAAWFALWSGVRLPELTDFWVAFPEEVVLNAFGRDRQACAKHWARLCELALERADEARGLMRKMG